MLSSKLPFVALLLGVVVWFGNSRVVADETDGIIRDDNWKIEIRPAPRSGSFNGAATGPLIISAGHQEEAPAPESAAKKPDTTPEPQLIGPALPPAVPESRTAAAPVRMTYAEAYAAVPFSRTEYEANPTYRHQAALELMFGVLRPTTLVQQYTPRASRYPDYYQIPYGRSDTQHINVRTFGGGYNFNGQSPFGYPYGVRGNW